MIKFSVLIILCYRTLDIFTSNLHFTSITNYLNNYKINTSANIRINDSKSNSNNDIAKDTQDFKKNDFTKSENNKVKTSDKNEMNNNQVTDFDKDFNIDKINKQANKVNKNPNLIQDIQNLDINNKQKLDKSEKPNTSSIDKNDPSRNLDFNSNIKPQAYDEASGSSITSAQQEHKVKSNNKDNITSNNKNLVIENIASSSQPIDLDKQQFIKNEILLLQLDETDQFDEYLEDFKSYVHRFWKSYYDAMNAPKARDVASFLKNYDSKYKSTDILPFLKIDNRNSHLNKPLNLQDAFLGAREAIATNDFDGLRAWLDNFKVLNAKDSQGNNLLTVAVVNENILMGRFLLDRGINFNSRNNLKQSAYDIAVEKNNKEFVKLLTNVAANYRRYANTSRKN